MAGLTNAIYLLFFIPFVDEESDVEDDNNGSIVFFNRHHARNNRTVEGIEQMEETFQQTGNNRLEINEMSSKVEVLNFMSFEVICILLIECNQ